MTFPFFLAVLAAAVVIFLTACAAALLGSVRDRSTEMRARLAQVCGERDDLAAELAALERDPCPVCAGNPAAVMADAMAVAETYQNYELARRALDHPALYEATIRAMCEEAEASIPARWRDHP